FDSDSLSTLSEAAFGQWEIINPSTNNIQQEQHHYDLQSTTTMSIGDQAFMDALDSGMDSSSSSSSIGQHIRLHDDWKQNCSSEIRDMLVPFNNMLAELFPTHANQKTSFMSIFETSSKFSTFVDELWKLWVPQSFSGGKLATSNQPCVAWMIESIMHVMLLMRVSAANNTEGPCSRASRYGLQGNTWSFICENPHVIVGNMRTIPIEEALVVNKQHPIYTWSGSAAKTQSQFEQLGQMASGYMIFRLLLDLRKIWSGGIGSPNNVSSGFEATLNSLNALLDKISTNRNYIKKVADYVTACSRYAEDLRISFLGLAFQLYSSTGDNGLLRKYLNESVLASRMYMYHMFTQHSAKPSILTFNPYVRANKEAIESVQKYPYCEQADLWIHSPELIYWRAIEYISPQNQQKADPLVINSLQFALNS